MTDIGFQPLRYLIGGDDTKSDPLNNGIVEYSYDMDRACRLKYGTLTSEEERFQSQAQANIRGKYAPYLPATDITGDYGEWMPDPHGTGFMLNVMDQINKAKGHVEILEMDNPDFDGLDQSFVMQVLDIVMMNGFGNVAKNPLNLKDPARYLSHPSIALAIVEHGCGGSDSMEHLRQSIDKPFLPVRFVSFGDQMQWARNVAVNIYRKGYINMGVTYSTKGEYEDYIDIILPHGPNA